DGELRRLAQVEERDALADLAVLGQVAPRLAHHPQRRARRGLASTGAQEEGEGAVGRGALWEAQAGATLLGNGHREGPLDPPHARSEKAAAAASIGAAQPAPDDVA